MTKGIDLSKHNGTVDFTKLKGNVDFVILRAGFGKVITQKDIMFETYYKGCKDNNIPIGVYWYSYATDEVSARKEAEVCYECIKGKQFEYPIFFDIEDNCHMALSKSICTEITKTFCNTLENLGYWCGVYSMDSFFSSHLDSTIQDRYSIWVARVENVKPTYTKRYDMWQYSWKGKFNGINTDTDCNYCYVDYPTLIKNAKKNGYTSVATTSNTSTIVNNSNYYNAPTNVNYATDMSKNVITTYKYSTQKNKELSKHFQVKEFASISGSKVYSNDVKIHNRLIQLLEKIFADFNCSKIIVNSGYRTSEHDKAVGGDGNGYHTKGQACDIICYNSKNTIIPAIQVCQYLEKLGNVYGIGLINERSVHIDTRLSDKKWFGNEMTGKSLTTFY